MKGAHPLAHQPDAARACPAEALEKVEQGFCQLITWNELKCRCKTNKAHKVSPIAAIPHKSRDHRMILDLSYDRPGCLSVNDSTVKERVPLEALCQLGNVLPCCTHALAMAGKGAGLLLMCKLGVKDGFW